LQRALHGGDRLQGVNVRKAGQARHLLVEARIVLHRARAQRIHAAVDRVVEAGEAHIMAHGLGLGEARQVQLAIAGKAAEAIFGQVGFEQVEAGIFGIADFEKQRFVGQESRAGSNGAGRAHAGGAALIVHAHASSSISAATRAAISASVVSSVAARMMRFSTSGSPGSRRDAGTPARMPRRARRSTRPAAGWAVRMVISLKKVLFSTST